MNMELQAASGKWLSEFGAKRSEKQDEKRYLPDSDDNSETNSTSWVISGVPVQRKWEKFRSIEDLNERQNIGPTRASRESSVSGKKMPNKENVENSGAAPDGNVRRRRDLIVKAKSKSLNPTDKLSNEEENEENEENDNENENEVSRTNIDKKTRGKSQKPKVKIRRQASLEEQFPGSTGNRDDVAKIDKEETEATEPSVKGQEKKQLQVPEELKVPKIEIMRKNGVGESFKGLKEFAVTSPNSSKLRERFSRSKLFKQDSKNLNVELSKSSDSGIGVSRSTEDESLRTSESVIFRFFDIGPDTRLNKSDSERSPNFLDTVTLFGRSRSHERSVSSDSSDKNLSDIDKPSIKIRKRHEYSESRDSSSSYEGSIFDAHISNRVRKLHEVALKQMSEESAKSQRSDIQKRSVDFKYPVEFGSYDSIATKTSGLSKVRKFKSLERTDSKTRAGGSLEDDEHSSTGSIQEKVKHRLKKQDRFEKRLSLKDKRNSLSRESGLAGEKGKEKRCRGFLKSRKGRGEDESDENAESRSRERESKVKDDLSKRLSRKDKKTSKKTKRALSEEHRGSRKERSLLFSITATKRRADSETRQGRREVSEEEGEEESRDSESSGKTFDAVSNDFQGKNEPRGFPRTHGNLNSGWPWPQKIFLSQKYRTDLVASKLDAERNRTSLDFVEIGPYLEVFGKIWPMSDDYKIVFISSDSSAKENRSVSTDSDSGSGESLESGMDPSKKLAPTSDCDWDYFESTSVRPVFKDWSWHGSPRSLSGTLFERASPVFSTSDDNSPKFPRRSPGRFSVRDSQISHDTDLSGFSSNLNRDVMSSDGAKYRGMDVAKLSPGPCTDANDDSLPTEEKEIEVTDLRASPPVKSKDLFVVKDACGQTADVDIDFHVADEKISEDIKKAKKRRKSKKYKKGNIKDEDAIDESAESKESSPSFGQETGKSIGVTADKSVKTEEEEMAAESERDSPGPTKEKIDPLFNAANQSASDDALTAYGTPLAGPTQKSVANSPVGFYTNDGSESKENAGKSKNKSKKQKSKKKSDKRGKSDSRVGSSCDGVAKELMEAQTSAKPNDCSVPDEFPFQTGSFGFHSQNLISSQAQCPEVFSYKCPVTNVLESGNIFQNFVPIPVPVLIPVPFPVPSAIWSQNYQNVFHPNFCLGSDNFEVFNKLQNLYTSNFLNENLSSSTRSDEEVPFKMEENNSSGTGSSSIHIRPINMQRPAITIGPPSDWSQRSVNSHESDSTCLTAREQPSPDKKTDVITEDSVVRDDDTEYVLVNGEATAKSSRNKRSKKSRRKSKSLTDRSDIPECEKPSENVTKDMVCGDSSDMDMLEHSPEEKLNPDIFVEGKTFRDVKNNLKHKSDLLSDPFLNEDNEESGKKLSADNEREIIGTSDNENVIVADDSVGRELLESSLLEIDRKSQCSSDSLSDDSDENYLKKPFRKSYYFDLNDSERKTSDDSDIADLSSSEDDSKTENSSHVNSTASEDEGNPDSKFSEIYVVNPSESELDLGNAGHECKFLHDEQERISRSRKSCKKIKDLLPLKNFPLSDDTDSDSNGNSTVILLNHVRKTAEDDDILARSPPATFAGRPNGERRENTEEVDVRSEVSHSMNSEKEAISDCASVDGYLHNCETVGDEMSSEDPVILVEHLADAVNTRASVAQSEIVPGSVPDVQSDSSALKSVFSEINSLSCDLIDDKIEGSSSEANNSKEFDLEASENDTFENNEEFRKSLRDGDVNYNAESEVINGDLLVESKPRSCVSVENEQFGFSKKNQNGLSLLDKIESRIRLFSQLDNFSVGPQENEAKYTSLVMITQDKNGTSKLNEILEDSDSVKVITSDSTKFLDSEHIIDDICLKHTNRKSEDDNTNNFRLKSLEEYYTMTLENSRGLALSPKKPNVIKNMSPLKEEDEFEGDSKEEVQVVTDDKTLSAVICLEEGLADDDSWVEDLEKDRENDFVAITEEDSSSGDEIHIGTCIPVHSDREEELRGYHRGAINFTLHTIVEESCEESEVEDKAKSTVAKKQRPTSATDLEKYFYFDIGGGGAQHFENQDLDTFSESSSSIYSDGGAADDGGIEVRENSDQSQLSTSRLEKYFLNFDRDGREKESDGSVGSDSEGPPSPEQRRKRLFRARASNRLHSSSLDNLVQSENEQQSVDMILDSEDSSTETDLPDPQNVDKSDDSVKRKKKRKISGGSLNVPLVILEGNDKNGDSTKECRESLTREHRHREIKEEAGDIPDAEDGKNVSFDHESDDDRSKTPQPDFALESGMCRDKQQSRDSGFIGSCDDLLKDQKTCGDSSGSDTLKRNAENTEKVTSEVTEVEDATASRNGQQSSSILGSTPPATTLTRKDSFNNWSSDEETNLMMSKMRQFFKAMVSVPRNSGVVPENSTPSSPQGKTKGVKSPQLVYFENELTRLMKTVPGIRDDQVREIVEYLSSEDTWSDSYDSSDYTSSDLEGTAAYYQRSQLQQEISESCKQIIDKFDQSKSDLEQKPKVPPRRNSSPMNRETALVYQKLVASFNKITSENENPSTSPHSSPPLFAKVMHHIGSRLVALMHEVSSNSSGEGSISSHKGRYHKRINQKLSNVSSTTEEECGMTDESDYKGEDPTVLLGQSLPYFQLLHQLPRSKSHDLLLDEAKVKSLRSSSSGVSDIAEEKEASDYERFSWRGSFESALMADSRSKLTLLSNDCHSCSTTLAAKRRSAGDLLFLKSLSREQLDRVRSCGSIGGVTMEDKNIWTSGRDRSGRRRSSVPDAASPGSGASADGDEDSSDSEIMQERSITLPRSLQSIASSQNTNSLPRLPTTGAVNNQNLSKAQSIQHFLPNAKSARYRPPGFSRIMASSPKRALSAPGLQVPQPSLARRERRRNQNYFTGNPSLSVDELNILESSTSPHVHGGSKSATPSPIVGSAKSRLKRGPSSVGSSDWSATDEIQRLVALDQQRLSSSSLGARSDSLASVYSGAGEGRSCSIPVRGEVEFGLQYNYKAGDLEIYVKQCKDLAAVDAKRNRSDPYVKVYLLPDKSKSGKRKTKVKKHTLNPIFDEVLKFHISLNGLETRTLWLTVWHSDMFGRNDFLGEVMMSLENKVFDDPTPQSYVLQERTEPFDDVLSYKGEIIIGLKFIPPDANTLQKKGKRSKGSLNVKVKEAKNLAAVKSNGVSDPFCKSYLLPDKGRNSKQKTPVQRRTCNPSWNHTFVYEDVSLQELSERCLELTVWDHDRLASNEFLGGLRFSLGSGKHYGKPVDWMDSTGKEVSLWQSMLEKPNLWVEGCLPLRASLDPPNAAS